MNKNKKIVILSPAHPLRGGIASSTERLAQELQHFDYKVTIHSFNLQYPSILFPGKTQYTDAPTPKDLTIKSSINSINPLNWWSIGQQLKKYAPDLIITRFWLPFMAPSLGTIQRIACKNKSTKVISIADNVIPHEKRIGDHNLTKYFINSTDGFVVMSRSVKNDIRQFTSDKPVTYVPHPIYDNYGDKISKSLALKKLNLTGKSSYLLFFGFIRDYKGLDLLLHAMADQRIRNMNVKLIVAGEYYGNQEFYENIIKKHQLEDKVILRTSYIAKDAVKDYFAVADMVVQPYKTATQSGISQLAYHFEKPMLVTDVGGLSEIVEHGKVGYVVDVDIKAIADSIVDFYENKRMEVLTKGVIENKSLFSWANMVKGIEDIWAQLTY